MSRQQPTRRRTSPAESRKPVKAKASRPARPSPAPDVVSQAGASATQRFRRNLSAASTFVADVFAELKDSPHDADRVERAANLLMIQGVIMVMLELAEDLSLDALVKLSRVVAEQQRAQNGRCKIRDWSQRQAQAVGRKPGHVPEAADQTTRPLSREFSKLIQELYGVELSSAALPETGNAAP